MHLVGFIIRIYHDAQSSECQILSEVQKIAGFSDLKRYLNLPTTEIKKNARTVDENLLWEVRVG